MIFTYFACWSVLLLAWLHEVERDSFFRCRTMRVGINFLALPRVARPGRLDGNRYVLFGDGASCAILFMFHDFNVAQSHHPLFDR